MIENINTILNKLSLIDLESISKLSAYQQSLEIRRLWNLAISSITRILDSLPISLYDPITTSSHIINILSTLALLSSVTCALIKTQIYIDKSDESIDNVIKNEIQMISYQIQIIKQFFIQSPVKVQLAQEAMVHHLNTLVDSLITYCLSPSNSNWPNTCLHKTKPYLYEQYSKQKNDDDRIDETFYNSINNNSREQSNTSIEEKQFIIHNIHSLKHCPSITFQRNQFSPTKSEQQPRKKWIFPKKQKWSDEMSLNHYSSERKSKGANLSLRFVWNTVGHSSKNNILSKKPLRNIRDFFQINMNDELLLKSEDNTTNKNQSITKETELQDSLCSSSIMSETEFLTETGYSCFNPFFELENQHLISSFTKRTAIHWSIDEVEEEKTTVCEDGSSEIKDSAQNKTLKNWRYHKSSNSTKTIITDEEKMNEKSRYCHDQTALSFKREKSRERKSNDYLSFSAIDTTNLFKEEHHKPSLLHLPTVENFLTIMDVPTSPDSSYYSAHSSSSKSSSQFTLSSVLLNEVTNNLAVTHIEEFTQSSENTINEKEENNDKDVTFILSNKLSVESLPPPVPPKDAYLCTHLKPQSDNTNVSIASNKIKKKTALPDLKITTTYDNSPKATPNYHHIKQALPPRRSSIPISHSKSSSSNRPSLPVDTKKKLNSPNHKPSKLAYDEGTWTSIFGLNRKEDINEVVKRARLGRSLGVPTLKKTKNSNNAQILKVTENKNTVLIFEILDGKLQVIAGTIERLFEKLADETVQDMDFVDIYLINHTEFISSEELLDRLISRFHLGPSPGEYEYFIKWQYPIQTKVLNVINRWIQIRYQDFKLDSSLERKLNTFLFDDGLVLAAQFQQQIEQIHYNLKDQINQYSYPFPHISFATSQVSSPTSTLNSYFPFISSYHSISEYSTISNSRRPSTNLFNLSSLTTPPVSPSNHSFNYSIGTTTLSLFISFESKNIARYLTLADYYFFKIILSQGSFDMCYHRKNTSYNADLQGNNQLGLDYIELMTKRSNMLSHWVVHELCSIACLKSKRMLLKKFIEIAKFCLDLNNFHTCMVIIMGLSCVPKLQEVWESLSTRDMNTYTSLQKLLDVSMNMRYYRQKIHTAKTPSIPFLPVVLKDYTFFNENSTFLVSDPHLINFAKFRSISQFIDKIRAMMNVPYWFASELTHFPFFPQVKNETMGRSLDGIAEWIEERLNTIQDCYLDCNLL